MGKGKRNRKHKKNNDESAINETKMVYVKIEEENVEKTNQRSRETLKEAKASNEAVDLIDFIAIDSESFQDSGKENSNNNTAEYVQKASQPPRNVTEDKAEGRKGKDIKRSSDQYSEKNMLKVTQEIKYCIKKDENGKLISTPIDYNFIKNLITEHNSKQHKQVKENRDGKSDMLKLDVFPSEKVLTKPKSKEKTRVNKVKKRDKSDILKLDAFPSEKGHTKSKPRKETRFATNIEDEATKQDVSDAELYNDTNGSARELKKDDGIYFEFVANDNTLIIASDKFHLRKEFFLQQNHSLAFEFKDENIQVAYVGNQILVSTKNIEFNVSMRNSNPVYLADEFSQTDNLV